MIKKLICEKYLLTKALTTAVAPHAEVAICVTCRSQASCSDHTILFGGSTQLILLILEVMQESDNSPVL